MPTMPRINSKATRIAFKILGKPENMQKQHRTPEQMKIRKRLLFEYTTKVK